MKAPTLLSCVALTSSLASAAAVDKRASSGAATVDLSVQLGTPQHLAAGFIYGLVDDTSGAASTTIPENLLTGSGFNYCRAGGAQLPSPNLGYAKGQLAGRLTSFLSNYRTSRAAGARFILLVHDLWGADGRQGSDFQYPGDNGSWTALDDFLTQVIAFIKKNNMQDGLDLDLWNEPDGRNFWAPDYSQYLETWTRMYTRFRTDLSGVPISGPSLANPPDMRNTHWTQWLDHVKSTSTVPDIYSYHLLSLGANVVTAQANLNSGLSARGLPNNKPICVNEYGAIDGGDQSAAGSAWYIGGFERLNVRGLRGNWGWGEQNLHNDMAGLLVRPGSGADVYSTSTQWWVYNYYSQAMTGSRVSTAASADGVFEVYATRSGSDRSSVKILAALRPTYGVRTYDIDVKGLGAVGVSGGTVTVRTKKFPGAKQNAAGTGPVDLGTSSHNVVNGQVTLTFTPENEYTAYAFEFV